MQIVSSEMLYRKLQIWEGYFPEESCNNFERDFGVFATSHSIWKSKKIWMQWPRNEKQHRQRNCDTLFSAFFLRFIFPYISIATWPRLEVVRFHGIRYLQFSLSIYCGVSNQVHETRFQQKLPWNMAVVSPLLYGSSVINGWRN